MTQVGAKGEVTYEIRGDDSKLESDLDDARKKVLDSAEKTAEKSEKIEKDTGETKKQVKEDVTEHHKKQNEEQERSDEDSGRKREEGAKTRGERLKSIASGTAKAIGAGFVAAGSAAVGLGIAAVNSANDMDKAMNQFMVSTGLGKTHTEEYQKVLEEIYKNNYGDSFEDIAEQMATVHQQMAYLDSAKLKNVTEEAFTLRDVFGYEVAESVRTADSLVENFGVSADGAFNLIAQGAQYGLDFSGELLDTINEYSPQFAKLGMSAEDMFQVFASGTNAGAWNLDKIGDAVKELSIRVIDGSETTAEGFKTAGLDADEMAKKFAAGGESAKEAFGQTIEALGAIEDPLARDAAGVALFGTMWEDLGADVITSLTEINDGIDSTTDTMAKLQEVKYNDLGSMFEGLKRSVEMLLLPLGEQLIPLLSELVQSSLPLIEECLPPLVDMVSEFAASLIPIAQELLPVIIELIQAFMPSLTQIMSEILPTLVGLISEIAPMLGDLVSQVLPVFTELLQLLLPPLLEIISALLPPLVELLSALMPILEMIIELLQPIIELFVGLMEPIASIISEAVTPLAEALTSLINEVFKKLMDVLPILLSVFSEVFNGIAELVKEQIKNVTTIFENLMEFISNVFSGNWEAAWENVKNIFKTIVDSLAGIFKAPIKAIIDAINGFLKGLNNIKIPDWVPGVGGKSFSIGLIPRLKKGLDFVPKDFMPAYLDYGERVLTQTENLRFNALGGLEGMERALSVDTSINKEPTIILGKGCIVTQTSLDGRVVAQGIAPYMDTELGTMEAQKERG